MLDNTGHKASLLVGANTGLNNWHALAVTPTTEEFCHSPSLPDYIEDKKDRGVTKSIDNKSVGSVINHNQRPADLWGEVINDAKSGMPFTGWPDFGNYDAGAN